jgi:hypothetical protein
MNSSHSRGDHENFKRCIGYLMSAFVVYWNKRFKLIPAEPARYPSSTSDEDNED